MVAGLFSIVVGAFIGAAHAGAIHKDSYATIHLVSDDPFVIEYECARLLDNFAKYTGCVSYQPDPYADPDNYFWENKKVIAYIYSPGPGSSNWCHEIAHTYGWKHEDGRWEDFKNPLFNKTSCGPGGVWR